MEASGSRVARDVATRHVPWHAQNANMLAIGMQGNLRTLGVPGENLPNIQYQLDDPRAFGGETIIVVGAGDAAIENALALADNDNRVILLNRNERWIPFVATNWPLRDDARGLVFIYQDPASGKIQLHAIRDFL